MAVQRGLGKGLDALFLDNGEREKQAVIEVAMAEIEPDRKQPRISFEQEALSELADSIRAHGVLQPVLLRPIPGGGYRIVAGERRFRAAHIAGLTAIPAIVREFSDQQAMEAALVENLQREDLNPVEEAWGYKNLIESAKLTQEQAAERVGRSRSAVTNALRLLSLPAYTLELLRGGKLTPGHAKALLSVEPERIDALAGRVADEGLSVRQVEKIAKRLSGRGGKEMPRAQDPAASEVEIALRNSLGVEVHVKYQDGAGTLSVDFYSKEQLYAFANRLGG